MKLRKVLIYCVCFVLFATIIPSIASASSFEAEDINSPQANPIIQSASCTLSSSKSVVFMLTANRAVPVSVISCYLYVYENGRWVSVGAVPLPPGKTTQTYGASTNCSNMIQNGKTYRVECVFQAETEQVSRSHERSY
jgi:hypothetical protein